MSTPANQKSDIQYPRALAQLGDRFLGNGETMLEFGAAACIFNFLLLDTRLPIVIDALSLDFEVEGLGVFTGLGRPAVLFKHQIDECGEISTLYSNQASRECRIVEPHLSQDCLFVAE